MQYMCGNSWCKQAYDVTDDDLAFYDKVSPQFGGKKYAIPPPTLCPDCRLQLRLSWRNDRMLYQRKADDSGTPIISMYHPESSVTVYEKTAWWSDAWDAKDYGQNLDLSRSILSQFQELIRRVPHAHAMVVDDEGSPYVNYCYKNKNCHLCFAGNFLEDSYYCYNAQHSRNCIDCLFVYESELCMECVHCNNCYNVQFALHSHQCSDSRFLKNCTALEHCTLCINLHHKKYCILNEQYSKEEYERRISELQLFSSAHLSKTYETWLRFCAEHPQRANENTMSEDCTGDYILQSKNCKDCYVMGKECQDCVRILNGFPYLQDAHDCSYSGEQGTAILYECMATGERCQDILFGNLCLLGSLNLLYCHIMFGSKHCFGCSNMRNASYCILNKQYTQEEYEALVPKIIERMRMDGEWGAFLPAVASPFGYNETVAREYFPLTREQALQRGYSWSDYATPESENVRTVARASVSDEIADVTDDILHCAIVCKATKKPFKIIRQELDYYRSVGLPLPQFHPDERHRRRMQLRNPRVLYDRACAKCAAPIRTTYAPERPEMVYCEECYLKEVY